MTDTLTVSLGSSVLSDELAQRMTAALAERCGASARTRTIVWQELDFVAVEPYLATASFAALLGVGRQLELVQQGVLALVEEAFHHTDEVIVALQREGGQTPRTDEVNLAQLVERLGKRMQKPSRLKLELPFRTYVVSQLEARLFQPLALDGREAATHYFCNLEVIARDSRECMRVIKQHLAADGAAYVDCEDLAIERVHMGDTPKEASVSRCSGRVYFAEGAARPMVKS